MVRDYQNGHIYLLMEVYLASLSKFHNLIMEVCTLKGRNKIVKER